MTLIDTHAHIYSDTFGDGQDAVVKRSREAGVYPILMPAIDSSTHAGMLSLEERHPDHCHSMMGIHPCSVKENFKEEIRIAQDYFEKRKFIAVGETGLDFYWDLSFKEQQYEAFHQQVEWARQYDIPVVIHSRNATDECIDVIRQRQDGGLKGVFHCFSGTVEQARQIMDLGFYLGIGGVLTFKNAGLDMVIKELGLSHIVLETDAPYLAPVPYRGKRNEPAYLAYIAEKLSVLKEMALEGVASITTGNAQKLFGL